MNGALKKRLNTAAALLATAALSIFHSDLYAADQKAASVCPSLDFAQFLPVFAENAQTQQRFTAPTVKSLALKATAEPTRFEPITTDVKNTSLAFPLIPPMGAETEALEISVIDDNNIDVIDKRAGNSNIKVLAFTRKSCWKLTGVEDWSINKKDLTASPR